jgi:beta-galactosidase
LLAAHRAAIFHRGFGSHVWSNLQRRPVCRRKQVPVPKCASVDQFYEGAAAVTQRKHGGGMVTHRGVYGEATLCDALIARIARTAKIPVHALPPRTQLLRRDDHWVFVNFQDRPVPAPAPTGAEFLVGGPEVEPAGVAVWRG